MTAFYNEIDPFAAEWLENLMLCGVIAPGVVDRRSIEDICPDDLREFTQVHFFAGIGVWSYALRQAGWLDDRPVWTGSCPCQPFSAAGKGSGFADERHLWPALHHLIRECGPDVILGEQVASKDGLAWLDLVQTDLEATGHAFGALDLCAAGVGAPHIRQRSFWMAHAGSPGLPEQRGRWLEPSGFTTDHCPDFLGVPSGARLQGIADRSGDIHGPSGQTVERAGGQPSGRLASICRLADNDGREQRNGQLQRNEQHGREPEDGSPLWQGRGRFGDNSSGPVGTGPTNGHWGNADWLACRDGKWRPVEPGTFPLAHGITNRVGSLRGYGNAIVAPLAQIFIETVMEYLDG